MTPPDRSDGTEHRLRVAVAAVEEAESALDRAEVLLWSEIRIARRSGLSLRRIEAATGVGRMTISRRTAE